MAKNARYSKFYTQSTITMSIIMSYHEWDALEGASLERNYGSLHNLFVLLGLDLTWNLVQLNDVSRNML